MPEITQLLEGLADRPPCPPTPVSVIRTRARQRRQARQRRTFAAVGVGLMAVIVAAGAVVVRLDRDANVSITQTTVPPGAGGLTLTPSTGLRDGDSVTLALDPAPDGEAIAVQCAAGVIDATAQDAPGWCGPEIRLQVTDGPTDRTIVVNRLQRTPDGPIDCADAPGACVVMVTGAGTTSRRYAPLTFADAGPLPTPSLQLAGVDVDGPIEDGRRVRVEADGLPAGVEVRLRQCVAFPDDHDRMCDVGRGLRTHTDTTGFVGVGIRLFHDIENVEGDWVACEPCFLELTAPPADPILLAVELAATATPIHPELRSRPGEELTIEGSGFQVDSEVKLAICATAQVDVCQSPDGGLSTDASGEFGLVWGGARHECTDPRGECSVVWFTQEGVPPVLSVPLPPELSG